MKVFKIIALLLVFAGCQADRDTTFVDKRDKSLYSFTLASGTKWMTENLAYLDRDIYGKGAWVWSDSDEDFDSASRRVKDGECVLYSYTCALQVCPEGWRLPSRYDWEMLIRHYTPGDRQTPDFYGFNLNFEGEAMMFGKYCLFDGDTFWTSDPSAEEGKAVSVAIRISDDGSIICTFEEMDINDAFYVRCISDYNTQ